MSVTITLGELLTLGAVVFSAGGMYAKMSSLGRRMAAIESKLDKVDAIETKLAVLDTKTTAVETALARRLRPV